MLTKEQIQKIQELWAREKKTASLSFRFGGSLQFKGSKEQAQAKLERLKAKFETLESGPALPTEATPAEEDFVEVDYRALSAAMLADRPIDFTDEKMLKKSTGLLNGQTVFKDHYTSVDNWVGKVVNTYWDDQTKGIPPGINATMRLDMVKDPMAVRGVLQGALHSASVTVSFEWKPSHPDLMEKNIFFDNLGNEVDGELVRVVVTRIEKFWEISLVWQGADEYAKKIDRPESQAASCAACAFTHTHTENSHTHTLSDHTHDIAHTCESFGNVSGVEFVGFNQPFNREENVMKEIIEKLKKLFGSDVTAENIEALAAKFAEESFKAKEDAGNAKLAQLAEQLDAANAKITELEKAHSEKVKSLEPDAELGKKYLSDERADAVRFCKLAKGEKVSDAILKTLESAPLDVVQAWKDEFKKEFEEKVPARCSRCGDTKVTRQSSVDVGKSEQAAGGDQTVLSSETRAKVINLHS